MALGLAKEGFLGSRGSLALSILDTFLRPRFAGSVPGPFFRTQAQGVNVHIHGLAVISEPDAWMINLFDKSAKHMVDHGPTLDVHLPIFPSTTDTKTKLDGLEFGNEVEFLTKNNATRASDKAIGGNATERYDLRVGSSKVTLWTDAQSKKPLRISQTKDMHTETFEYLSYEDNLAFDPSLFRPPSGLTIEESR